MDSDHDARRGGKALLIRSLASASLTEVSCMVVATRPNDEAMAANKM